MATHAVPDVSALHALSISEALALFSSGAVCPTAYLEHHLARIETHDGDLHTLVTLDVVGARSAAVGADNAYTNGMARALEGIPVGVKDVIDVVGLPTKCQSRLRLDHVARTDAAAVAALRNAGAIILGKTTTHEFAIGGPAFDLPFPPARNPWNLNHHPGGSSSGSGAGVAAGLFPVAIGTDTGGSVRHPASACGIVGLKPTYDSIGRAGIFPLAVSLDHVGSLARTVFDAALLCDVMAVGRTNARHDIGKSVGGMRVGYVSHFHQTDMPATPETIATLDAGADCLRDAGAIVVDVTLPNLRTFAACNRIILQAEALAVHGAWLRDRPQQYCALSRRGILPGVFLSAEDLLQAQRRRRQLIEAVQRAFEEVDVLLTASSMEPPCRIDDSLEIARTYGRQARTPFNVTGNPAITIPFGASRDGLPLSLQIAGRYYDEATVCRMAAAIERPFAWPPFAARDQTA